MNKQQFGTVDGKDVFLYTLRNSNGMEARIMTYGGIVTVLTAPDAKGVFRDVVLGFDSLASYVKDTPYLGCIAGRYANRIARGRFTLDGKEYALAVNNPPNHLHGGVRGFDKVLWTADDAASTPGRSLVLTYVSKDGEEGYPGALSVRVVYTVTDSNDFRIEYQATTDRATVLNLTQHSYFNLAGPGDGDILGHEVMIAARRFTPVDSNLIPTGELRPLAGSPLDFFTPTAIGTRINAVDEQLRFGIGYDHNYVLDKPAGTLGLAARVTEPVSGRVMEVFTTEPGVQFYTGNFLDGHHIGKGAKPYKHRYGFCLETQHFPNSPNTPSFPSTVLRPGEKYSSTTLYHFGTRG
jgi:aldose 1-epimerase